MARMTPEAVLGRPAALSVPQVGGLWSCGAASSRCALGCASGGEGLVDARGDQADKHRRAEDERSDPGTGRGLQTCMDMTGDLLKPAEVTRRLGVSRSWLYEAARQGRIPHVRLGGDDRPLRFIEDDLQEWIEQARRAWRPGDAGARTLRRANGAIRSS